MSARVDAGRFGELLQRRLKAPILGAFAYGSGVFPQHKMQRDAQTDCMIDYLVVVEDERLPMWHAQNARDNPQDYTRVSRWLTRPAASVFRDAVFFVADVNAPTKERLKYGVVGWDALRRDLWTWERLFLAGRLHKPTIPLLFSPDSASFWRECVQPALQYNFEAAVRVALLLNPAGERDLETLLQTLVGLSYCGDPRTGIAESPHKVDNILRHQRVQLEEMYCEPLNRVRLALRGRSAGELSGRLLLLQQLPWHMQHQLCRQQESTSLERVASHLTPVAVRHAVEAIVRPAALRQIMLGALSTRPRTACSYVLAKLRKRLSAREA